MKLKTVIFSCICLGLTLLSLSMSSCQTVHPEPNNQHNQKKKIKSPLFITEFMCNNKDKFADEEENYPDWIELENTSSDTVFLSDYILADKSKNVVKKNALIGFMTPKSRKVFFASGKKEKENHLNFKLDKSSGIILLATSKGELIQSITYPKQIKNHSYILVKNEWYYTNQPSPNEPNSKEGIIDGFALPIKVSFEKNDGKTVAILTSSQAGEIRYTTDGTSVFSKSAKVYKNPIALDSLDVITTAIFSPLLITKRETYATFINEKAHELPVVSLNTNPKNLWSDSTGIYVEGLFKNYADKSENCERKGSLTFYDTDGIKYHEHVDFKIYGSGTRIRPKKSMTIKAASGSMPNIFFTSNPQETIDGFVVRSCYSDASRYKNEVVKGVNDIMDSELLMQEYHPAVLYLNGKYWGLFNIYERKNDNFITAHLGEKVEDILTGNSAQARIEKGSKKSYYAFLDSLNVIDIKSQEAFDLINNEFELNSLIDFWINELYTLKPDRFNNRFWKSNKENAKWRFVGYDFDVGFVWPDNPRSKRHFNDKEAKGVEIFGKCIQNPIFAMHFFRRLSDFLNFGYTSSEVKKILKQTDSLTKKEFKRDYERWKEEWPKCLDRGDGQMSKILKFVPLRAAYMRDSIAPILGFDQQIVFKNTIPEQVDVFINGYLLQDEAIYFNDMAVTIEIKAKEEAVDYYWEQNGKKIKLANPISFKTSTLLELKKEE